ncbi:hypothetical protein INS49_013780 [Diaporthe citri]|uniref:uncharacterized protein n=1 Tax=Diaporthe citri TaxID=83186 RepID=UPI001C81A8AB|nr:uncharacterized protein INS49_013780 [Diaporthe citri]KAG6357897.1 hypothetical protein INS49_013780 [Diaporthe citri]
MYVRLSTLALAASLLSLSPSIAMVAALSAKDIPSDTPISALLSSAQQHLARGETGDALVYYDAAVARDPSDYLTYFKRATTQLSLGRTSQAADDFQKCLQLRPGFEGAHVQLAKLKAKSADWDGAKEQYTHAKKGQGSPEMDELLEAQGAARLAEEAHAAGNWDECINQAGVAIMVANRAVSLREMRSACRFAKGEVEEGMGDLHHIVNLKPGNTSPHVTISAITYFALADLQQGMTQIRKCLHSDPDSKVCKKLLKEEKAIEKTIAKVEKALGKNQPMTGTKLLIPSADDAGLIQEVKEQVAELRQQGVIPAAAPSLLVAKLVELACQGYYEMNGKKAEEYCAESRALDENSFYGLLHDSRKAQESEDYEGAVRLLEKAKEVRPEKQEVVNPLLRDAQIELKRSKTKDYYKVLGVTRDADEKQIKSAYRKLSKVHHPDKAAKQGLTKETAEKKMASINEAYEVLSDPELRARFDRGDDPNSQEQQNPFQGNPFGGQPFMFQQGHGGQQFQFKFGGGGGSPFGF